MVRMRLPSRTFIARVTSIAVIAVIAAMISACSLQQPAVPSPVTSPTVPGPTDADLQAAFDASVESSHLPGASAMVWWPSADRTWTGLHGGVALEDLSPIRSVTKSYTVTLILQLAGDGKLSLTDPISDYVEGVTNGQDITLANLAGMTSGIADYSKNKEFLEKFTKDFARQWTPDQLIEYGVSQPPLFKPGMGYTYSNTNTVLLGKVVEEVTGVSLEENYRTHLFEPLGLTHTSYPDSADIPDPHPEPSLVDGASGATEPAPVVNLSALGASGGIVTSLDELRIWGDALGSGSLIGSGLQSERQDTSREPADGPAYDLYGLGIGQLDGWWGHTGDGIGYQAAVFRQPGSGVVIAVLVNSSQDANAAEALFKSLAAEVGDAPAL